VRWSYQRKRLLVAIGRLGYSEAVSRRVIRGVCKLKAVCRLDDDRRLIDEDAPEPLPSSLEEGAGDRHPSLMRPAYQLVVAAGGLPSTM
jgi:hypothetical protein